jgi:hypothetical protein
MREGKMKYEKKIFSRVSTNDLMHKYAQSINYRKFSSTHNNCAEYFAALAANRRRSSQVLQR